MGNSSRYKKLISRISSLERNLLPAVKVSGNYSKKESDMIRSYVLLVHAEIESYFEDVASLKVQQALARWTANRTKSNCLLAIMSLVSHSLVHFLEQKMYFAMSLLSCYENLSFL